MKIILIILLLSINVFAGVKDLGVYGNIYEIKEKPYDETLMLEINEGLANLDNESMQQKVYDVYKVNYTLSQSKEKKKHIIDISFIVPEDIIFQGKVIHRKGERFSPYQNNYVLVNKFFILEQSDIALFVKQMAEDGRESELIGGTILLSQGDLLETEDILNSDNYSKYNFQLYAFDKNIQDRFNISSTPSIFWQEKDNIIVEEYPLKRGNQ